jgi:hypothetical protein
MLRAAAEMAVSIAAATTNGKYAHNVAIPFPPGARPGIDPVSWAANPILFAAPIRYITSAEATSESVSGRVIEPTAPRPANDAPASVSGPQGRRANSANAANWRPPTHAASRS